MPCNHDPEPTLSPADSRIVDAAFLEMRRQLRADLAAGRVPLTVRTFSDVHSYVDANEYTAAILDHVRPMDRRVFLANLAQSRLCAEISSSRIFAAGPDLACYRLPVTVLVTVAVTLTPWGHRIEWEETLDVDADPAAAWSLADDTPAAGPELQRLELELEGTSSEILDALPFGIVEPAHEPDPDRSMPARPRL